MTVSERFHRLSNGREDAVSPAKDDQETVVGDEEKNVLLSIISQLRPGCDLSRITLPTFILERKSMLERITNAMQHSDILLPAINNEDPVGRFINVLKFYMAGWHIVPQGVKKPMNPILGEHFHCTWRLPDGSQAFYVAEQVSHHPPASAYFYIIPRHGIRIDGLLKPKSRFLGNSAASMMEGFAIVSFLSGPGAGEEYVLTQPNIYARGILFGKLKLELGDQAIVKCKQTNLQADIEFKVKGFVTGTYNAIHGVVRNTQNNSQLYEMHGKWNSDMTIKDIKSGKTSELFNPTKSKPILPDVRGLEEQEENESRRLWQHVVAALAKRDQNLATDEKFKIEDEQRQMQKEREAIGVEWKPRFFRPDGEMWVFSQPMYDDSANLTKT